MRYIRRAVLVAIVVLGVGIWTAGVAGDLRQHTWDRLDPNTQARIEHAGGRFVALGEATKDAAGGWTGQIGAVAQADDGTPATTLFAAQISIALNAGGTPATRAVGAISDNAANYAALSTLDLQCLDRALSGLVSPGDLDTWASLYNDYMEPPLAPTDTGVGMALQEACSP